jgi:hypothetical protein
VPYREQSMMTAMSSVMRTSVNKLKRVGVIEQKAKTEADTAVIFKKKAGSSQHVCPNIPEDR